MTVFVVYTTQTYIGIIDKILWHIGIWVVVKANKTFNGLRKYTTNGIKIYNKYDAITL